MRTSGPRPGRPGRDRGWTRGADGVDVGRYLGLGLAIIVNLLNPRLVIIGGLLREVYPATEDARLGRT